MFALFILPVKYIFRKGKDAQVILYVYRKTLLSREENITVLHRLYCYVTYVRHRKVEALT